MDIDEAEAFARVLLANYIEGSASPRANQAMRIDQSLGLVLRAPATRNDNFDYLEYDGQTFGAGEGPEWRSTEAHQFFDRCPLRRCLVNRGEGNTRLLLRFLFVSFYEVGQYPPQLPGRPSTWPPPNTNTTPVRLPGSYELGVALANECVQVLDVFFHGELNHNVIGWDIELEWHSGAEFARADAQGGAFDAFEAS